MKERAKSSNPADLVEKYAFDRSIQYFAFYLFRYVDAYSAVVNTDYLYLYVLFSTQTALWDLIPRTTDASAGSVLKYSPRARSPGSIVVMALGIPWPEHRNECVILLWRGKRERKRKRAKGRERKIKSERENRSISRKYI